MTRTRSAAITCGMVAVAIIVGSLGPWVNESSGDTVSGMGDLGPLTLGLGLVALAFAVWAYVDPFQAPTLGWWIVLVLLGTAITGFARSVAVDMTPAPIFLDVEPGWGLRVVFFVSGPGLVAAAQLIRWSRRESAPVEEDPEVLS